VERLAWFDPPSNPGSTILMHRQPDDVWRIDYQIRDDEDPAEAVKPENVLPRVRSHLEMIGETEPWEPLWISIYNAKCLTLPSYRHGRVFFAGDAAHLVPIFGVRGLNSGLDDAGNLAWKLARVQRGESPDALLDSYSVERVHATRENIAYGAKSTEFMAPPDFAFRLMREAALRLALDDEAVRPLINPRQSSAIGYKGSPLDGGESGAWTSALAAPGAPAPEALLRDAQGQPLHLSTCFGQGFVALVFNGAPAGGLPPGVATLRITPGTDPHGQAWRRYGLQSSGESALVLVRPDGYVLGRWHGLDTAPLRAALQSTGVIQ
jgi:3-(3-hydroxy-phenyl)propionate hydroxylase